MSYKNKIIELIYSIVPHSYDHDYSDLIELCIMNINHMNEGDAKIYWDEIISKNPFSYRDLDCILIYPVIYTEHHYNSCVCKDNCINCHDKMINRLS